MPHGYATPFLEGRARSRPVAPVGRRGARHAEHSPQRLGQLRPTPTGELGEPLMARLLERLDRAVDIRRELAAEPARIVDVRYDDLVADPVATARSVYEALGIPWTPASEHALAAYAVESPRHKQGSYEYSLEAYGLTEALVRQAFAPFATALGLPD